jgi:signal transduction histidine kinase
VFLVASLLSTCRASFGQLKLQIRRFTTESGLPQNSIKDLAIDSKGFMWLATEGGLTRFDGRNFRVYDRRNTETYSNRVKAIAPGKRNAHNHSKLDVAYVSFSNNERANIINGDAVPVGEEIHVRDEKLADLRSQKLSFDFVNGLPERWGRVIGPDQSTMVASNFGDGEFYLCSQSTVTYYRGWKGQYQIPNHIEARLNYFVLGKRLYYLNPNGTLTHIYNNQKFSFPIKGDIARNEDYLRNKGAVTLYWNNKTDQVFLCINNRVFELIQEPDGILTTHLLIPFFDLDAEHIDIMYHDRQNNKVFLASSTNGLFEVSLPRFDLNSATGAGSEKLREGHVSLNSSGSLAWFAAQAITGDDANEDIVFDQVTVDGKELEVSGDTVRLFSKPENVNLHFSTAYFGNPENLKMSYSLTKDGEHANLEKWVNVDTGDNDLVIPYSSLPTGTFTFVIRKQAGLGLGSVVSKRLIIIVTQPWYQNGWLHLLFGLVIPLSGFGILRYRFRKIEARNQLLELQVSARTEELRQTLLTLESSQGDLLHQFHLQSRLLTSLAHDLRSPLLAAGLVTGEVGRLIKNHDLAKASLLNRQVEDAVGLIRQSLDELLTYIKVQVYSKEVKIEQVPLAELIDKSFGVYQKAARIHSNSFENNVPKEITVPSNSQMLNIIIRNLADNANKFTENGTISAHWTENEALGSLTIRDTGRGLPATLVEWFEQIGSTPIPEKFNGLGLVIVKELAPFAMIRLNIHSRKGDTQVTLHFLHRETQSVNI